MIGYKDYQHLSDFFYDDDWKDDKEENEQDEDMNPKSRKYRMEN